VVQYSSYFINILSAIASGCLNGDETLPEKNIPKLLNEQLYRIALVINKLDAVIKAGEVSFSHVTYMRLLDRVLGLQSIPFSGEPLSGIQIMGILETRALDFKNLIILSVNEGVLPSVSSPASSYIPFSLREAFGLPSINHRESIYAYHFFRLLHRAENAIFIYNSNTEGLKSGEISRFLIQMNFNPELKPETLALCPEIKSFNAINEIVERTDKHHEKLMSLYIGENKKAISPSAINMWLHCRMKFYYRYVCQLPESDKLKTEVDQALLGQILHDVMKSLYENFKGKIIEKSFLENLISQKQTLRDEIEKSVRNNSGSRFFGTIDDGDVLILKEALFTYITNILKADISYLPLKILGTEEDVSFSANVYSGTECFNVTIGGVADRIDIHENSVRVVDYKTGTISQSVTSISELFNDDRKKDHDGWLQTLLYCESLFGKTEGRSIRPSIYKIRKIGTGNNDILLIKQGKTVLEVNDYAAVRDEYIAGLNNVISSIFSKNEPFRMTSKSEKCKYCAYSALCVR
jgi:CRISPR/Cas system-associated exonuclease Cas4 (RecB family)